MNEGENTFTAEPVTPEMAEYLRSLSVEDLLDKVAEIEADHGQCDIPGCPQYYRLGPYRYELWRRIDNFITQEA